MLITNVNDVPETLYHYCSIDTFMKIIENKTIRLSNIFKMNDYSEVMHVLDFLSYILVEEYGNKPFIFPFPYKGIDNKNAFDLIVSDIKKSINEVRFLSYIACFSEPEEALGQWNRYGNDGKGVAICYDGKMLYKIAKKCSVDTYKVNYSDEDCKEYIKTTIVSRIFEAIKNAGNNGNVKSNRCPYDVMVLTCILNDVSAILLSAVQYKHHAYKDEREWRLCLNTQITQTYYPEDIKIYDQDKSYGDNSEIVRKKISFTNKLGHGVSSYIDLSFKELKKTNFIKEIIIGPRSIINKRDLDLKTFLFINGFDIGEPQNACTRIYHSKIPYRG